VVNSELVEHQPIRGFGGTTYSRVSRGMGPVRVRE